jgi:hypothetical protein
VWDSLVNFHGRSRGVAGAATIGTAGVPFRSTQLQTDSATGKIMTGQVISMMPEFKNKSLEELRFEDTYKTPAAPGMGASTPWSLSFMQR